MSVTLPPMEHTFTKSVTGSKSRRVWDGTFTFRIPNLKTESEIEKTKVRLNEGLKISEELDFLHEMVAYLVHCFVDAPQWWKEKAASLEIHDSNVYTELWTECMEFQSKWRKQVWDEGEDDKQDSEPAKEA